MLQGIYVSFRSAGNLFSGRCVRAILFSKSSSPPAPLKNGMGRPLPQMHFVFTHFKFKVSTRVGMGTRGEWIGCGYELLTVFHYPLSWAIAECTKEKKRKLSHVNLKEKRILSESNWVNYCIKYLEHKTWKSALVSAHEKFDVLTGPNSDDCSRLFLT